MTKSVGDIIREYLTLNGYDGLFNDTDCCACKVGDLFPCGDPSEQDCEPGYYCPGGCDHALEEDGWHIVAEKPKEADRG